MFKKSKVQEHVWVVVKIRVHFRVLLVRVPYYIGDIKRDLTLENCPHVRQHLTHLKPNSAALRPLP